MENQAPEPIRIELSPDQKAKIQQLTGKELDALQFTAEELEARLAPLQRIALN